MLEKRFVSAFLCALFIFVGIASAAGNGSTLIVIPSRYTVIQFAYDISKLRTSAIVAYEPVEDSVPAIHIWDKQARDWMKMSMAEYGSGDFPGGEAKTAVIMGIDGDVPASLLPSWCPTVREVDEISIMKMVNTLNKSMKFTESEWKWIAQKHRLKIKDTNAMRRRYGKYGPPGSKKGAKTDAKPTAKHEEVMRIPMPEPVEQPVQPLPEPPPEPKLPEPKELKELQDISDIAPEDK